MRRAASVLVVCMMAAGVVATVPGVGQVSVAVATDVTGRIALGDAHTCVIDDDDLIWCWGSNGFGQLGSATHSGLSRSLVPVRADDLPGSRRPTRIVAGASHTCVLANDGTVWCWGSNGSGQSGGPMPIQRIPEQVQFGESVTRVFAGSENTCVLLTDGALQCWGLNNVGQLGVGSADTNINNQPRTVTNIPASFSVRDLAIGAAHMCAISTANETWCWGGHAHGKLGTSGTSNVSQPQRTATLQGAAYTVAAGADHTCAALATSVTCFGNNEFGQLAFPSNLTVNHAPAEAAMGAGVVDVVAGANFTCVRLASSAPTCWGANSSYQLGPGTPTITDSHVPAGVANLDATVVDLALGADHGCAVMGDGLLRCWGENNSGQLGLNDRADRHSAQQVSVLNVIPTTTTTTTTTTITTTTTTTTTTPPTGTSAPTTTLGSPIGTTTSTPSVRLRRTRSITASNIAKAVSWTIPKTSQGRMRISITRGSSNCRFVGTSIRGVRRGTCRVKVELIPRRGKSSARTLTITVHG